MERVQIRITSAACYAFNQMLKKCLENEKYSAAFKTKGPQDSAESLFMVNIPTTRDDQQVNRKNTEQSKEGRFGLLMEWI